MTVLEKVFEFADKAHGDQKRKYSNDRYMVHPKRVMEICERHGLHEIVLAAALLHDVLEDTDVFQLELGVFLVSVMDPDDAMQTLRLVVELTDVYTKSACPQFNRRNRKDLENERLRYVSPQAQTIKYADIIDNGVDIKKNDPNFARVYVHECRRLVELMKDGNPKLREEALFVLESKPQKRLNENAEAGSSTRDSCQPKET